MNTKGEKMRYKKIKKRFDRRAYNNARKQGASKKLARQYAYS